MNLAQLAIAVVTGAVPLTASFYTYDRLSGSSSFKRSGYAALAGLGAGIISSLAMHALIGVSTEYPVMAYNPKGSSVKGLMDAWAGNMLPPQGGIPVNVYSKMPETTDVGRSFGVM